MRRCSRETSLKRSFTDSDRGRTLQDERRRLRFNNKTQDTSGQTCKGPKHLLQKSNTPRLKETFVVKMDTTKRFCVICLCFVSVVALLLCCVSLWSLCVFVVLCQFVVMVHVFIVLLFLYYGHFVSFHRYFISLCRNSIDKLKTKIK